MALSARSRARSPNAEAMLSSQAASRFTSRLRAWLTAWWRHAIRGRVLPDGLRAQLAYGRGERTLAVGHDPVGGYALVATDRGLYHRAGGDGWSRLGWEQISAVGWDGLTSRLVVTGLAGAAPPRTVLPLRSRGTVPELAEERITHTRLGRRQVMLGGHRRVLVEVRRRPVTGELVWVITSGSGLDLGDRQVREQIDEAVALLDADLGVTYPASSDADQRINDCFRPPPGHR
jgi:hypothetical protein